MNNSNHAKPANRHEGEGVYKPFQAAAKLIATAALILAGTLAHAQNVPPTVGITAPTAGITLGAPANLTIQATATDSDGSIAQVQFFEGSNLIGTSTQSPYSANWSNVAAGTYQLTAKATDDLGAETTSSPVAISVSTAAGQVYFIEADHLNTPRVVTNSANQEVWKWDNTDPYGANLPNQDADNDGTPFTLNLRFPGQYYDQETGLHYNYFRDYDPNTGRYVQSDPIGLQGGINTFAYVGGNPLLFVDPLGLDALCGPGMRGVEDPKNPGGQVYKCIPNPNEDPNTKICVTGECGANILPRRGNDPDECERICADDQAEKGANKGICSMAGKVGGTISKIPGISNIITSACSTATSGRRQSCVSSCHARKKREHDDSMSMCSKDYTP